MVCEQTSSSFAINFCSSLGPRRNLWGAGGGLPNTSQLGGFSESDRGKGRLWISADLSMSVDGKHDVRTFADLDAHVE